MEHTRYWLMIRRHLALVAVCTVLGAALGLYMHVRDTTNYVSTVRMYGNIKRADTVAVSQSTSLAVQRMGSYVKLVSTSRLAERLISRLNLTETSPSALADHMSASLDKDTVILTVNVASTTPDEAKAIADVLPAELTALVNQLSDVAITDPNSAVFTVVDGPSTPRGPTVIRALLSVGFGAVIGAALGLALASIIMRRQAGRSPDGLVTTTGLPVLGIVPSDGLLRGATAEVKEAKRFAYLRLARNLAHIVHDRHRVVVLTSPYDRPSASETTVGLARALVHKGQSVLVVDAGGSEQSCAALLQATPEGTVVDIISRLESLETTVTHTDLLNLDLLPLGENADPILTLDGGARLGRLLDQVRARYDTVLIDAAGVLSHVDLLPTIERSDAVLLVIDQMSTPWPDARLARDALRAETTARIGLVIQGAWPSGMPRTQFQAGLALPDEQPRDPGTESEFLGRVDRSDVSSVAFDQIERFAGAKQG